MKKCCIDMNVAAVEHLNERYVLLKLRANDALPDMIAGQFVEVRVDDSPSTFLRRPISINFFDRENNEVWLLVAAVGDGTRRLSRLNVGDCLNCVLPLGNGFTMPDSADRRVLLIGGGVGVAPLLFFGKQLHAMGCDTTFLLGGKRACDLLELDEFNRYGRVLTTTEDGSHGECGFVTNHSVLQRERFDMISCCGPKPMMMSVARYADKAGISCEVSLENKMACGLGACLCCVEKTSNGNVCVCKEGPVFNIKKLLWQI